ncbi:MAG: YkgJ family cysteine cluster protein [Alphaproteobacteria bacterium]|nr:YkgJ family cysteine cluster protein [Alphaproteobacteria bacterium]
MSTPTFREAEARAAAAARPALAARDLKGAAEAAIAAAEAYLALAAQSVELSRQLNELACTKGCTYCCHQMVGITEAEIALVQTAIASLPSKTQSRIKAASAALRNKAQGLSPAQWWAAKLRCPLLSPQGACLVHAARPLPCRAMNSADRAICQSSFEGQPANIPVLAAQHGIFGHAQAGLLQALVAAGRPKGLVILGTAL